MSEIRTICRKAYQAVVAEEADPALRKSLRSHERVPVFIENLTREFVLAERRGLKITRDTLEGATRDLTRTFIACVKRKAEERLMSPLAIAVKQAELDRRKAIREEADRLTLGGTESVETDAQGNETHRQTIKIGET